MASIAVDVDYAAKGDLLWLGNGVPNTDSAQNVTFEPEFDVFFSVDGACVGLYLFDAARILLPHLTLDSSTVNFRFQELRGAYFRDADTLSFGNGNMAASSGEVAEGLTAHYNETGKVVGFTLEKVRELLLPYLETWRPWTDGEMAEIRKQTVERDEMLRERKASDA